MIFAPNRLYPFETHGVFWRGRYHFGNIPLVNYLPDRWRARFCPHVRAYTRRDLRQLLDGLPVRIVVHTQIFPGYDKIVHRYPALGHALRRMTYFLERTPRLRSLLGLSHFSGCGKGIALSTGTSDRQHRMVGLPVGSVYAIIAFCQEG